MAKAAAEAVRAARAPRSSARAFSAPAWLPWIPRSALAACAVAAAPAVGCSSQKDQYGVTGQPTANSCGSGLSPPDPWTFDVELTEQGSTAEWNWEDGSAALSATLSAMSATFTASQTQNVDSMSCNLERDDTIAITLGTGSPPATFAGTISYTFSVAVDAGSTAAGCNDQLQADGGVYAELPCTVSYAVTGALE